MLGFRLTGSKLPMPRAGALGVHGDLEISLKPRLPEQEPLFWGIGELSLPIPKTLTDRVAIELSKCLLPT